MKIAYIVGAQNNPLYNGCFKLDGSYLTFGQHSFIWDFAISVKNVYNIDIQFYIDGIDEFPLTNYLMDIGIKCYPIEHFNTIKTDIIILDTVSDSLLERNFIGCKIGIIHNYMVEYTSKFYNISDFIICMTPLAVERQRKFHDCNKYRLCYQGVFCERFKFVTHDESYYVKSVLFYSRMDSFKGNSYEEIMLKFVSLGISVTVLGAGEKYDEYKIKYNRTMHFLDHKSCIEIPEILNDYDLIVSNGRGVMEALSSNRPVIAVGIRYCGLLTKNNILKYRNCNYTGGFMPVKKLNIENDLSKISLCYKSHPLYFRELALEYANVNNFIKDIIDMT